MDAATPSRARDPALCADLAPSAITTKLPADWYVEQHVGRIVGQDGAALGYGIATARRVSLCGRCGDRDHRGSEGAAPPASLRRGLTECGPK